MKEFHGSHVKEVNTLVRIILKAKKTSTYSINKAQIRFDFLSKLLLYYSWISLRFVIKTIPQFFICIVNYVNV